MWVRHFRCEATRRSAISSHNLVCLLGAVLCNGVMSITPESLPQDISALRTMILRIELEKSALRSANDNREHQETTIKHARGPLHPHNSRRPATYFKQQGRACSSQDAPCSTSVNYRWCESTSESRNQTVITVTHVVTRSIIHRFVGHTASGKRTATGEETRAIAIIRLLVN